MRLLLVDDEAPARAKARRALADCQGITIIGEAASGAEAVARIRDAAPDLVLLDVQMPGMTGFDVIDAIGADAMPMVVFVTAYDAHAVRAFEVQAFDYVLKPYTADRLRLAIARAQNRLRTAEQVDEGTRLHAMLAAVREAPRYLTRIMVSDTRQSQLLPVDRIDRVEADRNDVCLHTTAGVHRLRGSISELAARLDPERFLRINRSTIVRLDAIQALHPWSHGDVRVVMHDGTELTWSRRFRAQTRGVYELG